ncbi:MAG TPA: YezD family protein [Tepidiformaceae bacterium]|nr:YezD family protein [Tepidiformaceae bacterium]HMO97429.1 YezD family protein [Tepidiformaceae bacterium]
MNTEPDGVSSRWVREAAGGQGPSPAEQAVLGEVLRAIRRVKHGNVSLAVQDGKVVQLEVTEKKRF